MDPETLREVVHDPDELSRWLDARLLAAVPAEPDAELRHRTGIGVAARALRRLDGARHDGMYRVGRHIRCRCR